MLFWVVMEGELLYTRGLEPLEYQIQDIAKKNLLSRKKFISRKLTGKACTVLMAALCKKCPYKTD